jgi:DNA invertase Pin-like site-specific DNA recombinase
MRVAIYARISTTGKGQTTDNQTSILREYCHRMDYQVYGEYVDELSGGTSDRPQFKRLFEDAAKRRFDLVLFWSLDRWSREGTRATIRHMEQLESYGVNFKSYTEQFLDSSGIFKDVILALLSTLARQEKIRLSERVRAGLARSKKRGGRPKINTDLVEQIRALKTEGWSNRKIAERFQISHSTVGLYLQADLQLT